MTPEFLVAVLALIIAMLSFVLSWYYNRKDHERRKKQGTIEYFGAMTEKLFNVQSKFNDKQNNQHIDIQKLEDNPDLIKDATEILSAYERLSVGVNTGIFDFYIINRMAGSYIILLYTQFSPYIMRIRKDATRVTSYTEFEQLVNRIKEIRK